MMSFDILLDDTVQLLALIAAPIVSRTGSSNAAYF